VPPAQHCAGSLTVAPPGWHAQAPLLHMPERQSPLPPQDAPLSPPQMPALQRVEAQLSSPVQDEPSVRRAAQTPFAHQLDVHSLSSVHGTPFAPGPHRPATQRDERHSAALVHGCPLGRPHVQKGAPCVTISMPSLTQPTA
jgi:hypothetical protein